MRKKLSKSLRIYIRNEKNRIKKENPDLKEQEEALKNLFQKFLPKEKTPSEIEK